MKRLALLLSLVLVGCASEPKKGDYSFEMTNEIITSSIEIDDKSSDYSNSCSRKGEVTYKISVAPEDFTGVVHLRLKRRIGDFEYPELYSWNVKVINGEMQPLKFSFYDYSGSSIPGEYKAVCSMKSAKDFEYVVDNDSIIMLPGVLSTAKKED